MILSRTAATMSASLMNPPTTLETPRLGLGVARELLAERRAVKKGNVMSFAFVIGDRIMPSKQGLTTFRRWAGRQGTIIGRSHDQNIWVVRWDDRVAIESIHADFLAPLSSGQMDPDFQNKRMDAKGRRQA